MSSHRPPATSPLLPSVFPNEASRPPRTNSRASSVRASPALKDDLPLPDTDSATRVPYSSVTDESLLPPKNFQPFFPLVEDGSSGEIAHPAVHYVFSDDDPEVVTAASLRELGAGEESLNAARRAKSIEGEDMAAAEEEPPRDILPPLRPGVQERYVLVEMAQDGHTVLNAKSLCPDWAVTNTTVRGAPTFDGEDPNQAGGLMMKIEGIGIDNETSRRREVDAAKAFGERRQVTGGDNVAAMTQLVEGLRKRMGDLQKVMLGGEEGSEER